MSTYRLDRLFAPRSVAVVGASPKPHAVGHIVLSRLRDGGFQGALYAVNPKYDMIDGIRCVPDLDAIADAPDLVVIAAPPASVPQIVAAAGRRQCAAAVILTAGLGRGPDSVAEQCRLEARKHGLRLVGPNCLGVMAPAAHLDATFAMHAPRAGRLALISQSGAIAAGMVEWAASQDVGFSGVVSVGDMVDVDFADCLDYFATDTATHAILLYVEAVKDSRKFMSAARAAARVKPVVVLKAGRHAEGARAAATHTGALAGSDAVYDAAFRRAGLLRVYDLDELFSAAETLERQSPFRGKRLAILSNGGGLGVLAVDRLADLGGTLAALSPSTVAGLDSVLPDTWSRANPVDIIGDADAGRYTAALGSLLDDPANDAVLVLHVPTALADAEDAASAICDLVGTRRTAGTSSKPVFAVWLGGGAAVASRFEAARIPHFATEADAVRGIMHLIRYREAQDALMQTPDSLPRDFAPDVERVREVVRTALTEGRRWLDPLEVEAVLRAYEIPIVPLVLAASPADAVAAAREPLGRGASVAVKILSPDIVHKSDIGGVALGLASADAVLNASRDILQRATTARPDARLRGVVVQEMISRPQARELIVGLADDRTFGPVVVFGCGGTAVEVIDDKSLALPPLDIPLARDLIGRTRISRLLGGYRDVPPADIAAVELVLIKLAQLAADIPEIRDLDINPLLADSTGVIAVDARIAIAAEAPVRGTLRSNPRLALRPYPKEWEREVCTQSDRRFFVRPLRPDDEVALAKFIASVSPSDLRLRFFGLMRQPDHVFLTRLVQLDYARAIAFVAVDPLTGEFAGVVRLHADANHEFGEYAVLVRSDLKGIGLGWELMQHMLAWAREDGLRCVEGQVLVENRTMLAMCMKLGFTIDADATDGVRRVKLDLRQCPVAAADAPVL